MVVFVMDGSIGQAAFEQAKAFKDSVEVSLVQLSCALHESLIPRVLKRRVFKCV